MKIILLVLLLLLGHSVKAQLHWNSDIPISPYGVENPYQQTPSQLEASKQRGIEHTLGYPFPEPGILIPYQGMQDFFQSSRSMFRTIRGILGLKDLSAFYRWLGVTESVEREVPIGLYAYPSEKGGRGITYNCASCHVGTLFGQHVVGLPNKINNFYQFTRLGDFTLKLSTQWMGKNMMGLDREESEMLGRARKTNRFTKSIKPRAANLDTSVAQIIHSMNRRKRDDYATKEHPLLNRTIVPSYVNQELVKILPWWNLKYKNRYMIDGSLTKGSFIDFLVIVGEMMFGGDLKQLEDWFAEPEKQQVVRDLAVAILESRAPRFQDSFAEYPHDLKKAQAGQKIYRHHCASCHGTYTKGWEVGSEDPFENVELKYFSMTPVMNVGTGSRYRTMKYLKAMLGPIKIVKDRGLELTPTKGFVPPPLDGVWVNFPYLHNGSVPNLCELLKPTKERVKHYYFDRVEKKSDYDPHCLGYSPEIKKAHVYKTYRTGLSNQGHEFGVDLTLTDKRHLIEFLKTL